MRPFRVVDWVQSQILGGHMMLRRLLSALPGALALFIAGRLGAQSWTLVEQALGRTGAMQPGDVYRFSFPRRYLRVMVGDVQVRPSLALGSWVAFKRVGGGHSMVMGDLVLTDDEINPVITALQQNGVEQSALHNHIVGGTPHTMYLHIRAE